jgi:hypothetical protein
VWARSFYAAHRPQGAELNYLAPIGASAEELLLDLEMVRLDLMHRVMAHQTKTARLPVGTPGASA